MDEICLLIAKATARPTRAEKHRAFGEIVRRFQDMAFACAFAILGDFQLAQDAAQDAFITAWRNLDQLHRPEAFPGWLKRIVVTQCHRLTRNKTLDTVALDMLFDVADAAPEPWQRLQGKEDQTCVLAAIQDLPEHERMATTLFYIAEFSQAEVAAFLEVPVTTVKKRLYSARQKMKETLLPMLRDTLQEQRPSKDDEFANTVAVFNQALESFLDRVKRDRNIIAVILFGSLSHDKVWRKSDIDLILIGRDVKMTRREFCLLENGVNIHASLYPRHKFKESLEGALQGSFLHSSFAKSTLLYTTDDTIREYYQDVQRLGSKDMELQLLRYGQMALYTFAKAEKWFEVKNDLTYSFLWIMYTVESLAKIEVTLNGEITSREVIHQALSVNPAFFNALYFDMVHKKKDEAAIRDALGSIDRYLMEKICLLFRPVLEYLSEAGGTRASSEIDEHFGKRAQIHGLSGVLEWLAEKGVVQKVPTPMRLTEKSLVEMEEAAYYYDGGLF